MLKNGKYGQLANMLSVRKVVELTNTKPVEINGLFAVEKDKTKWQLILVARRANHYFDKSVDPQIPLPSLFSQLQMKKYE